MNTPRKDIHNSNVPKLCQSCDVRHKGMCGALNAKELVDFAQFTRVVKVSAGDVLLQEQGPVVSYANVMRGVLKLTKTLADGRQQIVGLQFAPDFVGRLHQDESHVRVEACSDVEICSITRNALRKMLEENPALEAKLLHQALREVDQGREWMLALGRKTAHEKVASFLMMMVRQLDPFAGGDAVYGFRSSAYARRNWRLSRLDDWNSFARVHAAAASRSDSDFLAPPHRHSGSRSASPIRRLNGTVLARGPCLARHNHAWLREETWVEVTAGETTKRPDAVKRRASHLGETGPEKRGLKHPGPT